MKKIILGFLAIALVGGIGVYFYVFHKEHKNTFDLKAAYQIEASVLFSEFEQDEDQANTKYLGKIVQVDGQIVTVKEIGNNYEISLVDELFGVTCLVDSIYAVQQKQSLERLKVGDKVSIKGQCNGFLTGVSLDRCILVEK